MTQERKNWMTSKTRKQRKTIPTFTWLMRRLDSLRRKHPEEFQTAMDGGYTTEILKGLKVRLRSSPDEAGRYNNHIQWFVLYRTKKNGDVIRYASIGGFKEGDEFYTLYRPSFSATEYSMRMHKYLPFDLPEGSCSAAGWHYKTPYKTCVLQNADGSTHSTCRWYGGRRGKPGYAENEHNSVEFIIRDRDGAFVGHNKFHTLENFYDYYFSNPIDLQHGFLPGTCNSKIEWYDSMANSNGLWDANKMRTIAARVHSEAIALTKKYPHLRIALYPMEQKRFLNDGHYPEFGTATRDNRFDTEEQTAVLLGRDSQTRPIIYWLPRIVLYWLQPASNRRGTAVRYIRATIPPVGCPSLLRDNRNSSCFAKVHSLPLDPGQLEIVASDKVHMRDSLPHWENVGVWPRQAYHCRELICLSIGNWGKADLGYSRRPGLKHGEADADAVVHDWNQDQNVVVVHNYSADEPDDDPKYEQPYAARPSGVFSCIEEKELLDSLPLV